jgi:hypothetical protein
VLGVVTNRYTVIQNREAFAFLATLLGSELAFETAGSLHGGKRVFVTCRLASIDHVEVGGDQVELYVNFFNRHDGAGAVQLVGFANSRGGWVFVVDESTFVDRSGARSKPLSDELDRVDVSAAVVQSAAKATVEGADVAVAEAAGISHSVSKVDGHLVHEPEGAAASRLCKTNGVRVELAERIGRQAL